jgi:hypothetical protein
MTHAFSELVLDGVLVAPFITYTVTALAVILILRPVLYAVGFAKLFSHPSIAEVGLYLTILGLLMVFL